MYQKKRRVAKNLRKRSIVKNLKGDRARVPRGLAIGARSGRLSLQITQGTDLPMTNRVSYAPQDFQKMCKQAERDRESKRLVYLMDRLKRQIAERSNSGLKVEAGKAPTSDSGVIRLPIRSVPLER